MKRIIIFCCLTLMGVDIMAQYEGNGNYGLFQDEFDIPGRTWNAYTYEESGGKWRAYLRGSGITHGKWEHQAYQRSQCVFDVTDGMMLLTSDYVSDIDISCDDLERPYNGNCIIDEDYHIRYLSGALQSLEKNFLYGYFEIRCKLPVHRGAFPAFWLWSACAADNPDCNDHYYEEIDIFEYTWKNTDPEADEHCNETTGLGDNRCYTAGMYYNETGEGISYENSVARVRNRIDDSKPSLDQWNIWGCLWMPDKVEWYINGEMVNSYYDVDSIPHNPMYLMTNYAIDSYAYNKHNETFYYTGLDTMYIDYIRVYQPIWDCGTSIIIEEQDDINSYVYGIKSSVTICSNSNAPIVIAPNHKLDIMASESVTINGPFQVDVGAEFSIRMQKCP